ncbi:Protein pitchfork [Schistosoma japonicum]|uniref:Protein pitchfork n=1 Tax=Schistosoma japonicum TaxID=6182 RepID=A0A4Z2DLP1_SCHJA|nr:Protein pitchfork [Schistosoma japonicum]
MVFKVAEVMNDFKDSNAFEKIKAILSKKRSRFAFGSCQERLLYQEAIPRHRLGVTLTSINQSGVVGPMTYNIQSAINDNFNKKGISLRGYTLGARTAHRMNFCSFNADFPDPGAYQDFVNRPSNHVKLNRKTFNQSALRTNKPIISPSTVGVGTYDVTKEPGRHVRWQMDTMLKPVNLPTIEQKSTIPINTDKVSF